MTQQMTPVNQEIYTNAPSIEMIKEAYDRGFSDGLKRADEIATFMAKQMTYEEWLNLKEK